MPPQNLFDDESVRMNTNDSILTRCTSYDTARDTKCEARYSDKKISFLSASSTSASQISKTHNKNMTDQNRKNHHQPNVSEWIANAIADTGCEVVYGGHGGALVPLVNAVVSHPKLTWVCARNEHDAATMAAAHAKLTGGLGVVIATSGPGATNLTTGLMEAQMDRVSLLAITGMKPTAQLGEKATGLYLFMLAWRQHLTFLFGFSL